VAASLPANRDWSLSRIATAILSFHDRRNSRKSPISIHAKLGKGFIIIHSINP